MTAARRITVTLAGGEVREAALTPGVLRKLERRYTDLAEMPSVEGSLYAAWVQIVPPGGSEDDFDAWVDSLEAIEMAEDPTEATPSPVSPDSQ